MSEIYTEGVMLAANQLTKEKEYWLNKLSGELVHTTFPEDEASPLCEWTVYNFSFSEELAAKLIKLSNGSDVRLHMLLAAGISSLLAKYTGNEDIIIGSPIYRQEVEGTFVNTALALRNTVNQQMTFKELLLEVKQTIGEAAENQNYPIETLLYQLDMETSSTLFDVAVLVENIHTEKYLEHLKLNHIYKFIRKADTIECQIKYNSALYKASTIERIATHLQNLLQGAMDNINQPLGELKLLSDVEVQQVLVDFNQTQCPLVDKTIDEMFASQAEVTPENIAVLLHDSSLAYRELNARANQLSRVLRKQGTGPESIVALMFERSLEMAIAILGVLKAGGAYLPIDPEYPEDRRKYILKDSNPDILLTSSELKEDFPGKVVLMSDELLRGEDATNLSRATSLSNLAYIIYTSGTTGEPKGVMVEHSAIANTIAWRRNEYRFTDEDSILQLFSYSFDGFLTSFFTPLVSGARVVFVKESEAKNPLTIKQILAKEKITHFIAVPTLYQAILECQTPQDAAHLRIVTLAGEKVSLKLLALSKAISPTVEIVNEYGPTENSVAATVQRHLEECAEITIGQPIANTQIYILSEKEIQPVGVAGEICIGGKGLARGYLNQPVFSAEKFVPNPWKPGERMYRTGDLARWLPDGRIEFLRRIDHQVKIRGYRIELGEIENTLQNYPGVKEAAVIVKEDLAQNKSLIAFYTALSTVQETELADYLSTNLPQYMLPDRCYQVEMLPQTPGGKINRRTLLKLADSAMLKIEHISPANELEEKLVAIWSELLRLSDLGVTDNFFEVGGHSLKASILMARIQKEFAVEISLGDIFKLKTIREMAKFLQKAKTQAYAAIVPVERREYYPVSSAQKRMYVLSQFDRVGISYNLPGAIAITGKLDKNRLFRAFQGLIKRHDSLRTSFDFIGGEPVQKILSEVDFRIIFSERTEAELTELAGRFSQPFDLREAPLLRVELVEVEKDRHVLFFDMHHIISDGTSLGIIIKDLLALYEGNPLPDLLLQYKDYAVWQNDFLQTEVCKKQESFWLKTFAGEVPILNLPTDFPRPPVQSYQGERVNFSAEQTVTIGLQKLAEKTESTLFMVLISIYNILLARYSGQDDIVIGTSIAGRPHADLENITGMFVNTLALRNFPAGGKCFMDFLHEVKTTALQVYENQDYQFEELVEKLNLTRDMSRNPLFDTMFVLQNLDIPAIELTGLKITPYGVESKIAKFDLSLDAIEKNGVLSFSLEYCTKLYKRETMQRLAGHFLKIASEIIANPEIELAKIEILSAEEKTQLLHDFNGKKSNYPTHLVCSQLFEIEAVNAPERTAVIFADTELTYNSLNTKANQLARILRAKGVKPNDFVPILIQRSVHMIIGVLAVLKAGGAYLPIDPDYPVERINYMLTDSEAKILLTEKNLSERFAFTGEIQDITIEQLYTGDGSNLENLKKPEDLVYLIYTSGTTGKPKGVMVEERNYVNIVYAWQEEYHLDSFGVNLLQMASFSFDVFAGDLARTLLTGGKMIICPGDERYNPDSVYTLLQKHKISIFEATPALVVPLLDYIYENHLLIDDLKLLILGSDICLSKDFTRLVSRYAGKMRIINSYGITEATIDTSYYEMRGEELALANVPIGKPLPNNEMYILSPAGELQPIGVVGELFIGGSGVARGYLHRPELTAEKFSDNPFIVGEKMYKTGDYARWLNDGNIEFLGRMDFQVKIRGYRIELGEIESALLKHPAIKEAAVVDRLDSTGSKSLCAYFTTLAELSTGTLRDFLSKTLPDYMIPTYFLQLEKLPLTPNGKVDRKSLPEPGGRPSGVEYLPARNEVEAKLAQIWQGILGIENVGINDNFFILGGDSIKAIQLLARLRKDSLTIEMNDLFQHPTIAELSNYVQTIEKDVDQRLVCGEVELTPIQRWFFTEEFHDRHHYNQAVMLHFPQGLNAEGLKAVMTQLIQHHDALRMIYRFNGEVVQFNRGLEGELFYLRVLDLREHENPAAIISEEVNQLQRSFNLTEGPLVKLGLFKTQTGDHLLIAIHHLIIDGVSWRIILEDLSDGYRQWLLQKPIILPLKTNSFKEWASKLQSYAFSKKLEAEVEYWRMIEETAITPLKVDYLISDSRLQDCATLSINLAPELTEKLTRDIHQAYNTEINDILLTALALAFTEWTGENRVLINLEGHGREEILEDIDISRTVGWFTSEYPVILSCPEGKDLGYQLKSVKEYLRRIPNKGIGYGILRYITYFHDDRNFFHLKPQISFNYLGQFGKDQSGVINISPLSPGELVSPETKRQYVLEITGLIAGERLTLNFEYNKNEYSEATMSRLVNSYEKCLSAIIEHCTLKTEHELTPSDLVYDEFSIEELADFTKEIAGMLED